MQPKGVGTHCLEWGEPMILNHRRIFATAVLLSGLAGALAPAIAPGAERELSVGDFRFDGPLGSEGASIERLEKNRFRVILGHPPNQPKWCNKLNFQITGNAKGNDLILFVEGPPEYSMNEYFSSWSYDLEQWNPVQWKLGYRLSRTRDVLVFPVFQQDQVWVGHQVPLSYEQAEGFISRIRSSRYVSVHTLGRSIGGRNLCRIAITDPSSTVPPKKRWVHYFTNPHPGEHNAQWRIIGMIEWLLSDRGSDLRKRSICHFVIMMSPDAPHHGWYRVNAQGVDMNRSYFPRGADREKQAHEAYVFQHDLESIMKSESPVTTLWGNHTAQGPVIPMLYPGAEIGKTIGPWTEWRDILQSIAPADLIAPMVLQPAPQYGGVSWEYGPHAQFGVTGVLCESGGSLFTKEENQRSGSLLIESLARYYRGTKDQGPGRE
jgi:hypothetical protein